MSLYDITKRTEALLQKYEKYDAPAGKKQGTSDDPFMEEYDAIEAEVEKLNEAASDILLESDRAVVAAKNAEIRRAKNILLSDAVDAVKKKVKKGKGVNKAVIAERSNMITQLIEKIYAIPDGMSSAPNRRPYRAGPSGTKKDPVILDNTKPHNGHQAGYYDHTEETQAFDKEAQAAAERQDKKLDAIGNAVGRIKDIAQGMNEELDKQNPIIDDVEAQMDKVTGQLKTNNIKLKGLVTKMRSSRNFCVDVILISVILAIGAYIYATFGPK